MAENKYISHSQSPCGFIFREPLFKKIGGLEFLLQCDFEVHKVPIKLSNFHKQILQYWKMIFTHNFSPHGSVLWNNRVITVNRKSIFRRDWYGKGYNAL